MACFCSLCPYRGKGLIMKIPRRRDDEWAVNVVWFAQIKGVCVTRMRNYSDVI